MPRVKWIMEKEGFFVIPVPLDSLRSKDYLDMDSLYPIFRAPARIPGGTLLIRFYECLCRLLFFWKGWI
ncbi:hypothetical protein L0Y49_00400 [bacterium]|nr:hypothetical protein [bacterium]